MDQHPIILVEEQFKIMADSAPVLIWISGVDKLCYFFNAGWLRFTGRRMEQEYGNGWAEGVHPDDFTRCLDIYVTNFDARKEFKMEYRLRRYDGQYRWLVDNGVPRFLADGTFAGYIGSCMDIDELLESERIKKEFISADALVKEKSLNLQQATAIEKLSSSNTELATSNEEIISTNKYLVQARDQLDYLNKELERRVAERTRELAESLDEQQKLNEEISSANEELAAANEEMTAANEALLEIQEQLIYESGERKAANEHLKASEQNIRRMISQAPIGMCILEGNPLYVKEVNDAFLEIIGKTHEEIKLKPYWEILPEAAAFYEPITDQVIATGQTYHAREHEVILLKYGKPETVIVDFVYEPMKDAKGKTFAIMFVVIDITEKVLSRKKVERAEESLRNAIDAAGLGTYSINTTDRIFETSARSKEFFGFAPDEEVPYEAAINQIHPDYRQKVTELVEAAITNGERYDTEYPVIGHHDGKARWVRGVGSLQHNDGKDFFTGILHDITEQKADEQRKNDFIGMVSHELKTPLTSLNAYLQTLQLKSTQTNDAFTLGALNQSLKQVKRMTIMINGFLNVSRLESGKIHIDKKRFDMAVLVKESEAEILPMYTSHEIIFKPVEETFVFADRDKIMQVINNLISNAVKYSKTGTTIQVACLTINGSAQVSVSDQGTGIDGKELTRIFERYYRIENNDHISGFGIGLYLSAEIIGQHNGRIWAESESGKGSTFYFSLPTQ